ncbi:MAG TPA: histidine kinase N-terminal 7TM domain-containing protein, partial [Candidatus Paceibacterota bacterium]
MNVFAVSGLVNAIISIVFGVLVIFENSRDQKNRTFFLLTLALAVWAGAYWRWMLATDYATALFWVRALSVASLFIPVFFFHWALLLIDADEFFINKVLVYGAYLVAIGTIYFVNTSYFITDLSQRSYFEFWPDSGVLYDVYFSYLYIGLITYSAYLLIKAFFVEPDKNKKGQILYVIFGGLFGFGGGLTNFPLWWGIDIPPYGNFLVAVFPFFLGYSILRYKLFNIRTMATEFMVFALLVFMFITTILSTNLTQMLMNGVFLAISAVVGITLIRIAHTLERTTEELSESNTRQENLIHFISHEVKG